MKLYLIALAMVLILITSCSSNSSSHHTTTSANQDTSIEPASAEISRLASLASKQILTVNDFEKLQFLIGDDDHANDELNEIKLLVGYKEFEHAAHGLSFIDAYLRTGKETLCPGHALLHYYVFKEHDEDDHADEAFEEAKEQMQDWEPKARAYDKKYPSGENFDNIVKFLNSHINDIENGNTKISEKDMEYLDEKASICVEPE